MAQIGFVGLGKMGGNMVERLMRGGHDVVVFDRSAEAARQYVQRGATAAPDIAGVAAALDAPRVVWIMVPAGAPVDATIDALLPSLAADDVIIEGGNSNFHDTQRRAARTAERGVHLVDSGTSGGVWGLENGYCLMVGGPDEAVRRCAPIFDTLAPPDGWAHVGPSGAGHYVKMVHNGIEYGLLQAYAEGYEILHQSKDYRVDLHQVAALWNRGSVVRSWLNELAERAFANDADLSGLRGYVEDSGMGRWTVEEAMALDVPTPVLTLALLTRFRSRQEDSFGAKVIAALRNEFGGHAVRTQ